LQYKLGTNTEVKDRGFSPNKTCPKVSCVIKLRKKNSKRSLSERGIVARVCAILDFDEKIIFLETKKNAPPIRTKSGAIRRILCMKKNALLF